VLNGQACPLCKEIKPRLCTIEEEAFFFSKCNISQQLWLKFKGFCAAHGVHIFQPWYKVCAFLKKLVGVEYTYGFIELQSRKKNAPQIQESEKATTNVPFMEVKDLFAAISYWIMLLDKNDQYMRKKNPVYSERWLLICGDMGWLRVNKTSPV